MRISYSVTVFISLALFAALPVVAEDSGPATTNLVAAPQSYDWNGAATEVPAKARLPDEGTGPAGLLVPIAGSLLAVAALMLGLTITIGSLRHDIRQRRVVYRTRRPASTSTAT